MKKIFEIEEKLIHSERDVILAEDEFNRFIKEMKLPIFRREFKGDMFTEETLYTFFNGRVIKTHTKSTKNW